MNDINTTDTDSLLSQLGLDSLLTTMVPMLVISTILIVGLMVMSGIRQRKQRQQSHQMQQDIHAIRELLEKRFATPTYTTSSRPEALKNDPQLPPQP